MNIKVLIVEDDPMVTKFNRYYLEQIKGFEYVGWAASGDEALKMLIHQEVDLILLDIYMPHTSGLQLLSSIREQGSKVDIIVISAASDNASIRKALHNGAVDYLIKPFEFARFQAALTAYQQDFHLMHTENLNQEQLDKLLRYSLGAEEDPSPILTIPKGLAESTLENIWNTIIQLKSPIFSTEDISSQTPISRISIRKYLAFLTDAGILEMELSYGSIGRPVYKYSVTPEGYLNINKYI
ncbi:MULTISPECIES: response regulator [unclassified Paenibacillus]|uniref:response regulator n=1 Tax=unclassified Paenibacillus TaxID=185978 RepID=UPI00240575E7|nr:MULTISPECIES: response regulator [unclassified Paenibacillus]MDF9841722.1 CitB family two-component system response regulator MalR [Paenibacillus sp. PastF-2]MDF9848166.1 CitB family two-component system response regulator MalR [Paenibacillus sp. PastM-2]MDF9854881.1 CitB family two-component system response regulator MalR [Paenibacillus sp. PastF-1]MDH6480151.1 CitB family two-component system response regulator MalR [Paenibacillus sp. PastH-2]MDH6507582.1 CitB family two-component system 